MRKQISPAIILLFVITTFVAGIIVYPQLPATVVSHWGMRGNANGMMPKFWGVFLLPLIMAAMFVLYEIIPRIDPLKKNIASFRGAYDLLWGTLIVYLSYIYSLSLAWNLGLRFNFVTAMIPSIALLFYVIGHVLRRARRNWFIGIRTPWTLSSDIVWEKTHRLGSVLFRATGIVGLLAMFLDAAAAIYVIVGMGVATSAIVIVYSYLEYRKLPRKDA